MTNYEDEITEILHSVRYSEKGGIAEQEAINRMLALLHTAQGEAVDDILKTMEWLFEGSVHERQEKIAAFKASLTHLPTEGDDREGA